ncbi:hypothetical protein CKO_02857 [Citrobacter koseri ATCC BAA-895]|uniref:Uncharacterized protein n=1 Tax=Citrobacter koseri (strain ATCC BAA-895 / CDC 4225-83 / SGSC4696) TaxID=290338 RepID=A8AKF1_CITK8|nr:hypothetical protein CKO_02857 [Citrobacter koseri ATCC BAA-895]
MRMFLISTNSTCCGVEDLNKLVNGLLSDAVSARSSQVPATVKHAVSKAVTKAIASPKEIVFAFINVFLLNGQ